MIKIKPTVLLALSLVLFATSKTPAQDTFWINNFGGDFFDANNWSNGVPGPNDNAIFDLADQYFVNLTADATINGFDHPQGSILVYGGNALEVDDWSDSFGTLTITHAGTKMNFPQVFHIHATTNLELNSELEATKLRLGGYVSDVAVMNLDPGTKVRADNLYLGSVDGFQIGGVAQIHVDDLADVWIGDQGSSHNSFIIGATNYTPEVYITGGSVFDYGGSTRSATRIAEGSGTSGKLVVKGTGSLLSQPSKLLYLGYYGDGEMRIENGGEVVTDSLFIAYTNTSTSSLTMTGNGSFFDAFVCNVGFGGTGVMKVLQAAEVDAHSLNVGNNLGDGSMTVNGVDSYVETGYLNVGLNSSTGNLTVSGSGKLYNGFHGVVGAGVGSSAEVIVTGVNSRIDFLDELYLGADALLNDGGSALVRIEQDGTLQVGDETANPVGTKLMVSGTNSPYLLIHDDATLVNKGDSFVGYSNGNDGLVEVSGLNALWSTEGSMHVGHLGQGQVEITDGFTSVLQTTDIGIDGVISVTGGIFESSGGVQCEGNLLLDNGTLVGDLELLGSGELSVNNLSEIDGSIVQSAGQITINANADLLINGDCEHNGQINGDGLLRVEGNLSTGPVPSQLEFAMGTIELGPNTNLNLQIGGTNPGEFDSLIVQELISDVQTQLSVSLVDGFQPSAGQSYLIVERGIGSGQLGSYPEGAFVIDLHDIDFFITYVAGDGNDIALYTTQSVSIAPQAMIVTRGNLAGGTVGTLRVSDNVDVSVRRSQSDILSRTEIEVAAASPINNPNSMEIRLEGSVFARSTVTQTVFLYDFSAGDWEQIDSRNASRFTDRTDSIFVGGNLSRFVNQTDGRIRARVRCQALSQRQVFTSNTDSFSWIVN